MHVENGRLPEIPDFSTGGLEKIQPEFSASAQIELLTNIKSEIATIEVSTDGLPGNDWVVVKNNRKELMVVFQPDVGIWLKIAMNDSLHPRFVEAQKATEASLGLSEINPELTGLRNVVLEDDLLLASQTPHLGISIRDLMSVGSITLENVWLMYQHAHRQACYLAYYGWLFADTNRGNIVISDIGGQHLTLIDFHNRRIATSDHLSQPDARFLERRFVKQLKQGIPHDKRELEHISNKVLLELGRMTDTEYNERTFFLFDGERS